MNAPSVTAIVATKDRPQLLRRCVEAVLSQRYAGPLDLIVLTGAAKFVDDEHDQTLQGETLKVWLTSTEGGPAAAAPRRSRAAAAERVRPAPP